MLAGLLTSVVLQGCGGSNDGVDLVLRAQCINGVQSSCRSLGLPTPDTTVYSTGNIAGAGTAGNAAVGAAALPPLTIMAAPAGSSQ